MSTGVGERERRAAGFTLVELIIVLTIIGILAGATVPLFRDTTEKLREERAMRDLYGTLKFAQERAISETTEYRVYLDEKKGRYWTSRFIADADDKKSMENATETDGEPTVLPEGIVLKKTKARQDSKREARYIAFYPSGACDVASVTVERKNGKSITVSTKGKLGQFKVREER